MPVSTAIAQQRQIDDIDLVRRAAQRDRSAIRGIIKSHNQRLFRLARAIVKRDEDAEDVLQEAYLRAFANLDGFRGDSSLSTWLSRITINEALTRLRKGKRLKQGSVAMEIANDAQIIPFPGNSSEFDPERLVAQRELLRLVEHAIDDMADAFRSVFVARVIEGLSVEETAEVLDIQPTTVKTRLHRARKMIRERLEAEIGPVLVDAFPFAGKRCDRLTVAVLDKLGL
jgi:RNA polymerase sigma-70 factor (ECF subfamily)